MKKVIVEIHYMPDEQGKEIKIIIDGMEMDDVDYLSKIPFGEEWFQPSDGRWGWQGLVEEIRDRIEDREAELTFAFYGRPEYEDEFGQCLKKRGINQGERSKTEIVEKNLDDAKRNEHLGRYKEAFECYKIAAELGEQPDVQNIVGEYYKEKYEILNMEKSRAMSLSYDYFEKAAEQGDMKAQYHLFELFSEGEGVGKNIEEAVKWLRKSAALGNEEAQFQLGRCYAYGNGTEQNHNLAVFWYRKAAVEKNYAPAQRNLGLKYERGEGVEKNVKTAFQWYKCAADNPIPHSGACYQIAESYYEQINPNSLLKNTALVGAAVLIPIANVFTLPGAFVGSKIQKSMAYKKFLKTDAGKDMLKYYRKAAELGHEEAKKKLEKLNKYL